jgi:hypothetical protein
MLCVHTQPFKSPTKIISGSMGEKLGMTKEEINQINDRLHLRSILGNLYYK